MPTKEKPNDAGRRRARRIIANLGEELLSARRQHGLSQERVARAAGMSRSQVSRVERGLSSDVTIDAIARLLAIVGLELSARAFPGGPPVRDSAQLALLARFKRLISPGLTLRTEVPLPIAGDQRAWDGVIDEGRAEDWMAVEFETQPRDIQELLRHQALKRRDDPRVSRVLLVLGDNRHNRRLVREFDELLRSAYPTPAAEVRASLAEVRLPKANGLLLV